MFAPLMAADPGALLDQVLARLELSHDVAWRVMGFTDAAQFSRALHGERPLCVRRIQKLPWAVKAAFWSLFIADAAVDHTDELLADRKRMARAELTSRKAGVA